MYIKSQSGSYTIYVNAEDSRSLSKGHVILSHHNLLSYISINLFPMFRQHGLLCYAQFHKQERERNCSTSPSPPLKIKTETWIPDDLQLDNIRWACQDSQCVCEVPPGDLLEARNRYYLQLSRRVSNIYLTLNWDDRVEDQRQLKAPVRDALSV